MRTNYIFSELDNIAAGRTLQHPEQIPDYSASGKYSHLPQTVCLVSTSDERT
jgi:hypothetical protein